MGVTGSLTHPSRCPGVPAARESPLPRGAPTPSAPNPPRVSSGSGSCCSEAAPSPRSVQFPLRTEFLALFLLRPSGQPRDPVPPSPAPQTPFAVAACVGLCPAGEGRAAPTPRPVPAPLWPRRRDALACPVSPGEGRGQLEPTPCVSTCGGGTGRKERRARTRSVRAWEGQTGGRWRTALLGAHRGRVPSFAGYSCTGAHADTPTPRLALVLQCSCDKTKIFPSCPLPFCLPSEGVTYFILYYVAFNTNTISFKNV